MPDSPTGARATAPTGDDSATTPAGIDSRGPRFGAATTAALLVITLLLGSGPAATVLLTVVALLFALGATRGVQGTLAAIAFRTWIRPRLAPPVELEDPRPPRFAQVVGLVVVGAGLIIAAAGVPTAVPIAAAAALVAAFLNAAFGLCLGCELYLVMHRWNGPPGTRSRPQLR